MAESNGSVSLHYLVPIGSNGKVDLKIEVPSIAALSERDRGFIMTLATEIGEQVESITGQAGPDLFELRGDRVSP